MSRHIFEYFRRTRSLVLKQILVSFPLSWNLSFTSLCILFTITVTHPWNTQSTQNNLLFLMLPVCILVVICHQYINHHSSSVCLYIWMLLPHHQRNHFLRSCSVTRCTYSHGFRYNTLWGDRMHGNSGPAPQGNPAQVTALNKFIQLRSILRLVFIMSSRLQKIIYPNCWPFTRIAFSMGVKDWKWKGVWHFQVWLINKTNKLH